MSRLTINKLLREICNMKQVITSFQMVNFELPLSIPADLVTFTEEILSVKLHFCAVYLTKLWKKILKLSKDFSYCSFIPESSRWLLTHGKFEEIRVILKRLAKWNGRVEPDLSLLNEISAKELDITRSKKKYSYLSLLKFKSTRLKILLCSYMW